jgi:UDP-glucose 4-epimerase
LEEGYAVIVLDNYSNSDTTNLHHIIQRLSNPCRLQIYKGDVRDPIQLDDIFSRHRLSGVIHLAGLKSVNESVYDPLRYYDNNVFGCCQLLQAMLKHQVSNLIFSSSATVYGDPRILPLNEDHPIDPANPYGKSKRMCEQIIEDVCQSRKDFRAIILRYFNPVGSHPSLEIAERPRGTPNNLMPYIVGVVRGLYPRLNIFGTDYPTPDGTAIRDYIHVVDLAKGHLEAWKSFFAPASHYSSFRVYNLGTGSGVSVLEMVQAMREISGHPIAISLDNRREGDVCTSYADNRLAMTELNWKPSYSIADMCRDSLKN